MTLRAIKNSPGSSEELGLLGLGARTERDCLMSVVLQSDDGLVGQSRSELHPGRGT